MEKPILLTTGIIILMNHLCYQRLFIVSPYCLAIPLVNLAVADK